MANENNRKPIENTDSLAKVRRLAERDELDDLSCLAKTLLNFDKKLDNFNDGTDSIRVSSLESLGGRQSLRIKDRQDTESGSASVLQLKRK
ncbi:MAG: hypothetical protein HRU19_04915 [Pseudobacteriovorax sp.]|nr:hypothetical protein [Pseudobacteriovorax sp.]